MNNFFNPRRFGLLFIKHTAEHIRTYLMSLAVLAGVALLGGSFIFFIIPSPPDTGFQTACFVMLLLISGTLFTSTIFSDYGSKTKAIPAITLPASAFEKYLVGWLYSYPIFIVIYTGVFFLILSVLANMGHWQASFQYMTLRQPDMYMVLVIYSLLHSVTIFGAIFFNKLHFIKTGFSFFIGYGFILLINTLILKAITGLTIVKLAMPFGYLTFFADGRFYSVSVQTGGTDEMILVAIFLSSALIWVAAYFRLKEKQ